MVEILTFGALFFAFVYVIVSFPFLFIILSIIFIIRCLIERAFDFAMVFAIFLIITVCLLIVSKIINIGV